MSGRASAEWLRRPDKQGSPTKPLEPGTHASTTRELPKRAVASAGSKLSVLRQKLSSALAWRTQMPPPRPSGTQAVTISPGRSGHEPLQGRVQKPRP